MCQETAVLIGAGPASLTAAYELLQRTRIRPIVLEKSDSVGGLARTVHYRGNRMDLGGHRFFSKSDRVMQWWLQQMPLEATNGSHPQHADHVMLLRSRRSRIYYRRALFEYPINLNCTLVRRLGLLPTLKIGLSYAHSVLFPIRPVATLEDFFINRFGRELYRTFFKSYTEKVWGKPCSQISAEWGAQRVKGLSISKALWHAVKKSLAPSDIAQKDTETSLIERFLYPKHGPGQMWEHVADEVRRMGGKVLTNHEVRHVEVAGNRITAVEAACTAGKASGQSQVFHADYFFSSMPVKQLVRSLSATPPTRLVRISEGLEYRAFITVGLLVNKLKLKDRGGSGSQLIPDNWIYIHEPDVGVGRMQVFNNWSPALVADPSKAWIGLEYFCNEHDELWVEPDDKIMALAVEELTRIGLIDPHDVIDGKVIRVPKAYPAYFGTFGQFDELRSWLDRFENLFLIGRNGMHRYNNMDHSMLTAMVAVDNILEGQIDKANIWAVNAEQEYHEQTTADRATEAPAAAHPAKPRSAASSALRGRSRKLPRHDYQMLSQEAIKYQETTFADPQRQADT